MAADADKAKQQFAAAANALTEHLAHEECRVQKMRRQLEEDLDHKLPAKRQKGSSGPDPSASDTIKLNVGGDTSFTTRRDTLTAIPGSRMAELFSGRWDESLRRDEKGRVFLDLDPVQFRALLTWLVDLKRVEPDSPSPSPPIESLPPSCGVGFLPLCSYLCCKDTYVSQSQNSVSDLSKPLCGFRDSSIVSSDQSRQMSTWLREALTGEPCFKLLFRVSRDGCSPQVFHQKCDGQGPTVVIAKSGGGHLFGGYTETSWDSSGTYKDCRKSFLFRLAGPGNIQASKHPIHQNYGNGVYCEATLFPVFGGGNDMRIFAQGSVAKVSFSIGHTYSSNSPQGSFTYLAETQHADVTDFEVFHVEPRIDLRGVATCLESQADTLATYLGQQERNMLEKVLSTCTAALEQGSRLVCAETCLHSRFEALDQEARFLNLFMGTSSDVVRLDVGGKLMETLHSTLTFFEDSTLATKFGRDWTLQRDELVDGAVFFDEDPNLFQLVLMHLRLAMLLGGGFSPRPPPGKVGPWHRLINYLNLQACFVPAFESQLVVGEHDELLSMLQESNCKEWLQVKLKLLFRASRDGCSPQVFHQKCDGQGPTVVIAKSGGGHLFGGYTETSWDSSGTYKDCRKSFLFRLAGPGNIQASKHPIHQNYGNGVYCEATLFPVFGGGNDMRIFAQGSVAKVRFNIGHTYSSSSPQGSFTYLAETQQADVTDLEVFAVTVAHP